VATLERGGPGISRSSISEPGDAIKIDGALAFILTRRRRSRRRDLRALERDTVRKLEQAIAETKEARNGRLMLVAGAVGGRRDLIYLTLLFALVASAAPSRGTLAIRIPGRATQDWRFGNPATRTRAQFHTPAAAVWFLGVRTSADLRMARVRAEALPLIAAGS
jgi:hypothetical protein